jgi:hypothetical protein
MHLTVGIVRAEEELYYRGERGKGSGLMEEIWHYRVIRKSVRLASTRCTATTKARSGAVARSLCGPTLKTCSKHLAALPPGGNHEVA